LLREQLDERDAVVIAAVRIVEGQHEALVGGPLGDPARQLGEGAVAPSIFIELVAAKIDPPNADQRREQLGRQLFAPRLERAELRRLLYQLPQRLVIGGAGREHRLEHQRARPAAAALDANGR